MTGLPVIELDESKKRHVYKLDGEKMPSVTQIIDAFDPKPALTWWAWRVGMSTVVELLQTDAVAWPALMQNEPVRMRRPIEQRDLALEKIAIEQKIHPNAIRDERKDEGTAIHDALNEAARSATVPVLSDFDPQLRGYIQSFSTWFVDTDPLIHQTEVLTGSRKLRYCGKFDIDYSSQAGRGARELGDFKTQDKPELAVYDAHHHQLRGYLTGEQEIAELLRRPDDEVPQIGRTIVLSATGERPLVVTSQTPKAHWENLVAAWYTRQDFMAAKKAAKLDGNDD